MMKHNDFCLPDGMSAETFLADYWQKKPLLVRAAMPEAIGQLEPNDIQELA